MWSSSANASRRGMPWARADSGAAADSLPTLQSVGYFRSVLRKPSKSIAIIYATLERWPGGILHGFPLQSFSRVLQQVVKLSIIRPALEGVRYPWCGPPPAREQNDALRIRLLEPGRCIEFDDALVVNGVAFGLDHAPLLSVPAVFLRASARLFS